MSSPSLPPQSDDELFDPQHGRPSGFETVETVPIDRFRSSPELETLASLLVNTQRAGPPSQVQPRHNDQRNSRSQYITQPTQLIDHPMSEISSPPTKATVQVAASSPVSTTPAPASKRPSGILASAMAPAGTAFRRPYVAPPLRPNKDKPFMINSDDEDRAFSSDSDRAEQERTNIKTSTFRRAADKIPESPGVTSGLSKFQQITQGSRYDASEFTQGIKRSSDTMANAYGSVSKKPRQSGPSRAMPVTITQPPEESDIELEDITDPNARSKVRRMRSIYPNHRISDMYQALQARKGNFEDAVEHLMVLSEAPSKPRNSKAIDLTGSEDELMMTPAAKKTAPVRAQAVQDTRQQAKKPTRNIAEKWSGTQTAARKPAATQNKKLDIFDDPGPAPAKPRKLVRGRREPSPPRQAVAPKPRQNQTAPVEIMDDSDGEDDVKQHSDAEDGDFNDRLLRFFNTCSAMDLADTASIARDVAEHFVSKRPFKTIAGVEKVENPHLKPTKSKRKTAPLGEKIVEKVDNMLRSYEAVDYLVKKCEEIAKPLTSEMKAWGIDIYGKAGSVGELDMTSLLPDLAQSSGASHDSGLGTPISDDDHDSIRGSGKSATKKLFGQPASLAEEIKMKDYQVVGINWLNLLYRRKYSCILADDMGLGKTLQTIAFIAHLAETGVTGPHLIVVPAATLENWFKEFARFCPGLRVEPYYATNPGERAELRVKLEDLRDDDDVNVVITTYTIAKAKDDFPWLRTFGFCCSIFDEGHVLKNADSKVSKNLMRIQSKWRLLLTGTPLQNNLKELMSLLFFLMPDVFKQKQEELEVIFKQDVKTISEDAEGREMLLSKKRIDRARGMLTPFILRRKKWQVLKDLPKKDRLVEFCTMTDAQDSIYNGWLARAYDIRDRRSKGEHIPFNESANILMKLRLAAIHPLLFRHSYHDSDLKKIAKTCLKDAQWAESNPELILEELLHYSDFEIHQLCTTSVHLQKFMLSPEKLTYSGKVQAMVRLLNKFIAEGHRVLIFSQFVLVLNILEFVLSAQGTKFFRLDGNTKVTERQDLIDEFNEEIEDDAPDAAARKEQQVSVFMLSTKAGGAGINLASASRVIIFDSGFNPQDDVQAENRAHRIGQKKAVEVWRLVTKGSVEEQIYGMGEVKLRLDKEVAGEAADDGDQTSAKAGDKQIDAKDMEGMQTVQDMLFQQLGATPKKATSTESVGEATSTVVNSDHSTSPGNDAKQSETKTEHGSEQVLDASKSQRGASEPKSDGKEDAQGDAEAATTKTDTQSIQAKDEDVTELPARTRATRPKAGSRKTSSQSQSKDGKLQTTIKWSK